MVEEANSVVSKMVDIDNSFGGSAEEVQEALERNSELASKGFSLSDSENEVLSPEMYNHKDGKCINVPYKAPEIDLGILGTFTPKRDENPWKHLYYAQKGIISQLEQIIEDLQTK